MTIRFINALLFTFLLGSLACQPANEPASVDDTPASVLKDSTVNTTTTRKTILFFGNSLTAAYGLEPSEGFPALIQEKLDSLGYDYRTVNAGLSGETTASGASRLDWVLEQQPVDIFVLELGANDGLRGIATAETQKNLKEIISKVRSANPEVKIILAGMMVPPNMGNAYTDRFQKIFPAVAAEQEVTLIPFLLEDVAGEPELNQTDGIHPTAEGQQIVAENVWEILQPLLIQEAS